LGEDLGGVFELNREGGVWPVLTRADGVDLPPSNFVLEDRSGRIWLTVSTRHYPRDKAYRSDIADGFIVLQDKKGARIVADGLGYTNEAALSPDGKFLYVNETFGRKLTRFRLKSDGSLSEQETIATFSKGTYPDGLAFDAEGGIWITSIVSNRVICVHPDGAQQLILEDADEAHIEWVEEAFRCGTMGRAHLDRCAGRVLKNISSLAFGGPDRRMAVLGCLQGDSLACFPSPVEGLPPLNRDN
jgi:hypothetical protein